MAAYAALVSLMRIIHEIEDHPSPPISIHKQQVESLTQNVTFLQEFLDHYDSPLAYSDEADPLEIRIADAAHAAEDVIESRIMDRIHTQSTTHEDGLYQDLHQVIEEMNLIKKQVSEIVAEKPLIVQAQAHVHREVKKKESLMVGFDQVVLEVLEKLTRGQLNRQIIPITGMGGIGKTTLARNLFENALTKEHFDIRVWTTISQVYNTTETLREILCQATGDLSDLNENELGETLYKYLSGRRYLIVLDDIWSVEAWDKMKFFFPDYNNGSRIIVTTRLSDLSSRLSESYRVGMKFLDKASSWDLFCKTVCGEESIPPELEEIGERIVANCRGLPLSIATIGGLLAKSERTIEHWKHIEGNLNSIVIANNEEFCLKVLKTSYVNLPNYLKPCFLYMGVFEEDSEIRVPKLMKQWVSEGFLKPVSGKCLETTAEEYLKDLVDRNLILVHKLGSTGNIKYCKIHDLLRDLCLREAVNERFSYVLRQRSLDCDGKEVQNSGYLRLLTTLNVYDRGLYVKELELVNSRYLDVTVFDDFAPPSSINLIWNLQMLSIYCRYQNTAPVEIWKMHHLRHVEFDCNHGINLPDPPSSHNDIVVLGNLQTLKGVMNLYLDEHVVKRIPNIRKLFVRYELQHTNCLSYLECLSKLETFVCSIECVRGDCLQTISFPHSLKKLILRVKYTEEFVMEDILQKVGSLPLLQKLVLEGGIFRTRRWETVEGQFHSLKVLELSNCRDLDEWMVSESYHFPRLQELHIYGIFKLEIPSEIGEIATLKSILLRDCGESVLVSAKKIVEEQEELLGDQPDLHVRVLIPHRYSRSEAPLKLKHLASPNFHFEF